jgi:hypothetical protein
MNESEATGTQSASEEKRQQEELSIYASLLQKVKGGLEGVTSVVDAEVLKGIIDKASAELKGVGEYSVDAVTKVTEHLKKDLSSSAGRLKPLLDTLGKGAEQAADAVHEAGGAIWSHLATGTGGLLVVWRDKAGGALSGLLGEVSGWSGSLGQEIDTALTYRTGELTFGGRFECKACGSQMQLKKPGHLPPCPKCHKTAFKRG